MLVGRYSSSLPLLADKLDHRAVQSGGDGRRQPVLERWQGRPCSVAAQAAHAYWGDEGVPATRQHAGLDGGQANAAFVINAALSACQRGTLALSNTSASASKPSRVPCDLAIASWRP